MRVTVTLNHSIVFETCSYFLIAEPTCTSRVHRECTYTVSRVLHIQISPYLSIGHQPSQDVVLRWVRTTNAALLSGSGTPVYCGIEPLQNRVVQRRLMQLYFCHLNFSLTGFHTVTEAIQQSGDISGLKVPEGIILLCTIAVPSSDALFTFVPANEAGRELKVAFGLNLSVCFTTV